MNHLIIVHDGTGTIATAELLLQRNGSVDELARRESSKDVPSLRDVLEARRMPTDEETAKPVAFMLETLKENEHITPSGTNKAVSDERHGGTAFYLAAKSPCSSRREKVSQGRRW